MKRPWVQWTALIVVGAVFERRALKIEESNSTLSEVTRSVYRTHTAPGRIAFLLSWGALTAWFVPHIIRMPRVSKCDTAVYNVPTVM